MSSGRVSLAYRDITDLPGNVIADLSKFCRVLDLTSNMISDLQPLRDVTLLEELILDDNKITSHTKFPPLARLQTLWVNRNQISHLTLFIDKLVASCPELIMLSMLNNEACPNYFNNGTPTQYQDYRYYVINRMVKLQVLDSTPISATERAEAHKKYGTMTSTTESEATRRTSESQAMLKKRADREKKEKEMSDDAVRQRKEARKAKRTAKQQTSAPAPSSTMPKAPPPPPPMIDKLGPAPFKLPELPDIDPDDNLYGPKSRVLPPIPPARDEAPNTASFQAQAVDHSENVDWDDNDSDWSDSE